MATLGTRSAAPASCRSARSSTIRSDDAPNAPATPGTPATASAPAAPVTPSPNSATSATLPDTRRPLPPHGPEHLAQPRHDRRRRRRVGRQQLLQRPAPDVLDQRDVGRIQGLAGVRQVDQGNPHPRFRQALRGGREEPEPGRVPEHASASVGVGTADVGAGQKSSAALHTYSTAENPSEQPSR